MRQVVLMIVGPLLLVAFIVARERQQAKKQQALGQEIERLSERVHDLGQSSKLRDRALLNQQLLLGRTQAGSAPVEPAASAAPPADPADSPPEPFDPAKHEQAMRARVEAALTHFGAEFASEPTDRAWAREAEAHIQDQLERAVGGEDRIVSLSCRTSLCQAEIAHASEADWQTFLKNSMNPALGRPWLGEVLTLRREGAGGTIETVVYFGRKGRALDELALQP